MQPADHPAIDKIILLLVSGITPSDLRTACTEKLNVAAGDVNAVVAAARRRITVAADYDRDEEVGKAVTRLNDLYARAIRNQDTRTALATQREINRLLSLYQPAEPAAEIDSAGEELEQVREHLLPLKLGRHESSTVELVRLAVTEILRSRRG